MARKFLKLLVLFAWPASVISTLAGNLDKAPFHVVVPAGSWKLDDSTSKDLGPDDHIIATITSTNSLAKSLVVKTDLKDVKSSTLDEFCAGMRDQFSQPGLKVLTDEETTFLGQKARRFIYDMNGAVYNKAMVFVTGNTGWTILCAGPVSKKEEVDNLLTFYRKQGS